MTIIRPVERWLVSDGCHAPAYPCIAGRYYYHSANANHQRARQPSFNAPLANEWLHATESSLPSSTGDAFVACEVAPRVDIVKTPTQQYLPHQTRLHMTVLHP